MPRSREALDPMVWALASCLLALAGGFAYRQWVERAHREAALDPADDRYFTRKDRRRWLGTSLLGLIGVLMIATTRVAIVDRGSAQLWAWLWIVVLVLVVSLIVLAAIDWAANARFAQRQHAALRAEFRESLRQVTAPRRRPPPSNGEAKADS